MTPAGTMLLHLLMLFGSPAQGARHVLFDAGGNSAPDYNRIVDNLKQGDEVVFSNGDSRRVVLKLGQGKSAIIFRNEWGRASRIPIHPWYRHEIDHTFEGYFPLKAAGAPVIHLYEDTYLPGEHVEVEALPSDAQTARQWHDEYESCISNPRTCTPAEREALLARKRAYLVFRRGFAPFSAVGDFGLRQVSWVRNQWLLIDWMNHHELARSIIASDNLTPAKAVASAYPAHSIAFGLGFEVAAAVTMERLRLWRAGRFPLCPEALR